MLRARARHWGGASVTRKEAQGLIGAHLGRESRAKELVIEFARQLVFTLRDAGRDASAKELERLLFAVDVEREEFVKLIGQDPEAMIKVILGVPE